MGPLTCWSTSRRPNVQMQCPGHSNHQSRPWRGDRPFNRRGHVQRPNLSKHRVRDLGTHTYEAEKVCPFAYLESHEDFEFLANAAFAVK